VKAAKRPTSVLFARLGIEQVAVVDEFEVASVDLMTRSRDHADLLECALGVQPFSFTRGKSTLHAFPRVPAVAARQWLEDHGLDFVVTSDGLREDGPTTWVQGGFPPQI
jgi:hypothetical protein